MCIRDRDKGVNVYLTIDREQPEWDGHVGFVPSYLKELEFSVDKTVLVCGPPIMIKFVLAALQEMGFEKTQEMCIRDSYGPGYEMPYKEANDDIRYLARTEGIFTDPVYSGKSFHGMMDYIRSGKVEKGSTVIYLHTGGATALFSENAIIGDLNVLQ